MSSRITLAPASTMQEQEKVLRRSVLTSVIDELSGALCRMMAKTYYEVFREPERLAEFLLPLTWKDPGNSRVHFAVIERVNLLAKCTPYTQERARQSAAALGKKAVVEVRERDYQLIPLKKFGKIMRKEFQLCGPEGIRAFFDVPDLAAWFKLNTKTAGKANYKSTYQALCERCPNLKDKPLDEWSSLCGRARQLRNDSKGHDSPAKLDKLMEKPLRESMAPWLEIVELLRSEELNQEEYEAVRRVLERGEASERREVVPFQALGCANLEHSAIRSALESVGVRCEADCALSDSAETLRERLEQVLNAYRWVPLDSVVEESFVGEDQELTAFLNDCGFRVEGNRVFCVSAEQVRTLLELRQARQGGGDGAQWADLPKLETLADYRGGPLSPDRLVELIRTHQLVLDASVLRSKEGRDFIQNQVVPRLEEMRKKKTVFLVMEATARRHLYQDCEACKAAERGRTEREKLEQLRSAKTAYHFAQDWLHRNGLLRYIGVPVHGCRDEEALRLFLRRNPGQRMCVLTCGAVGKLTETVRRRDFPLCAVARVRRDFMEGGGQVCQIFPAYLPLETGGRAVVLQDRDDGLLTEAYAANAFGGSSPVEPVEVLPVVSEEDTASAMLETEDIPVPKQPRFDAAIAGQRRSPAFPPDAALRILSGERLPPLSRPVAAGDLLVTEEGEAVRLTDRLWNGRENIEGGEGALYQVETADQVAKLYHSDQRTRDREQKLKDMLDHNPGIKNLCWPTHLLYTGQGEFVGCLIPKAPEGALDFQRSVLQLAKPTVREKVLPGWDRRDLVCTALAVADLLSHLHANNILMGDVNDGNFMVDPDDSSSVWLVDSDSYQFDGWPCPVSVPEYTHPDTAKRLGITGDLCFGTFLRLKEEENYVLAILLFRILMLGQYPFNTRGGIDPAQAMRERRFPYTVEDVANIPAGDSWMIWKNMPRKLAQAFLNTFQKGETISARDWVDLLDKYLYCIDYEKDGYPRFTRELTPLKYRAFNQEKPFYQDVVCEIDQVEFNMPISKYQAVRKHRGWHTLCPKCWDVWRAFKQMPAVLRCGWCGKEFTGNAWQKYLNEKLNDPIRCPACWERLKKRGGA